MAGPGDQKIGAKALLENVSCELSSWARVAERLDDLIGEVSFAMQDDHNQIASQLQDMDALRQAIQALAKITSTASKEFPADADVLLSQKALAEDITLESVRIACLSGHVSSQSHSNGLHDIHLF